MATPWDGFEVMALVGGELNGLVLGEVTVVGCVMNGTVPVVITVVGGVVNGLMLVIVAVVLVGVTVLCTGFWAFELFTRCLTPKAAPPRALPTISAIRSTPMNCLPFISYSLLVS